MVKVVFGWVVRWERIPGRVVVGEDTAEAREQRSSLMVMEGVYPFIMTILLA